MHKHYDTNENELLCVNEDNTIWPINHHPDGYKKVTLKVQGSLCWTAKLAICLSEVNYMFEGFSLVYQTIT